MVKKKILVIATYPIKNPQHGGQKRVAAIIEAYKEAFTSVKFVAVFHRDSYPNYNIGDMPVTGATRKKVQDLPLTGDIVLGEAIYKDKTIKHKFIKMLKKYRPDIIEVSQVFPYMGLEPLLKEIGLKPKIIFGSQNIEYKMKQEMLESVGNWSKSDIAKTTEKIRQAEEKLCEDADLVVAVSASDAEELKAMKAKNVVVANNGISLVKASLKSREFWTNYYGKNMIKHSLTFVGSAHPPNWFGFLSMIGKDLGFIPSDTKLFLAGSISDYFKYQMESVTLEHVTFWQRAVAAGRLSDDRLAGLIEASDVILLPITEGGGSNLKTAEAILSEKKIVATSFAFRSFEQYIDLPNIYIANPAQEFRTAILHALQADYIPRSATQKKLAQHVQWQYSLEKAVNRATEL